MNRKAFGASFLYWADFIQQPACSPNSPTKLVVWSFCAQSTVPPLLFSLSKLVTMFSNPFLIFLSIYIRLFIGLCLFIRRVRVSYENKRNLAKLEVHIKQKSSVNPLCAFFFDSISSISHSVGLSWRFNDFLRLCKFFP